MFDPNNDRLDYGAMLTPPVGYKLDFAVGTTYSLDLDALVGASLSLGLAEETDSDLMMNPICLLEALRATGDRVALFCEGGQIHMPHSVTPLYVLLEKMVFQVTTKKRKSMSRYPSFHPKIWLLRFVDKEKRIAYRIVVLSRNLTFDHSWDVTFSMDGEKAKTATDKNKPLCEFLSYLTSFLPQSEVGREKKKRINEIIKELGYVNFELNSKEFFDFDFIPNGIPNFDAKYNNITEYPLFTDTFTELLIISPFLSNSVIKDFNCRNSTLSKSEYCLITRAEALERLKAEDCDKFKIYTMKSAVIDGEGIISEENSTAQKQDIHAKVYMIRKNSNTDLYLGSLNASFNALNNNIEFMVRLQSKNRYLNLEKVLNSLFCGAEGDATNPFEQSCVPTTITHEEERLDLDKIVKDINRGKPHATVSQNGDRFDLTLSFPFFNVDCSVTVSPLFSKKVTPLNETITFSGLELTQLSEFYVMTVSDGERSIQRVVIIPTDGIPNGREKAIVSSVISEKDCFVRYLAFLLGDSLALTSLEIEASDNKAYMSHAKKATLLPALYEKMLKTVYEAPERFDEIDYLVKAVSDDGVIPDEFKRLYSVFKRVVKANG